jgi:hypothetical protein
MEDVTLNRNEMGWLVVPFPDVDADMTSALRNAVWVIHMGSTKMMCTEKSLVATLRGMDFLGHTRYRQAVVEKLWALLSPGTLVNMLPHVNEVVRAANIQRAVLQRLLRGASSWELFSGVISHSMQMDLGLATEIMQPLARFFPAGPLFCKLVGALPSPGLDSMKLLELYCAVTPYLHPREVSGAMTALFKKCNELTDDPHAAIVRQVARGTVSALTASLVAPECVKAMHGSVVFMPHGSSVSVLLQMDGRYQHIQSRTIASWVSVVVNWDDGNVDVRLVLAKLCGAGSRGCQVRLTGYKHDTVTSAEKWYELRHPNPNELVSVAEAGVLYERIGNPLRFGDMLVTREMSILRIDVFYGVQNVMIHSNF